MEPTIKIHTGNCLDVLKEYPDNYFDSIVTDPPYGLGKEHNITNYVIFDDDNDFLPSQESRFIQTGQRYGITYDDAEKAIQILNS